ncbi:hypothetical protein OEB99_04910 [Actinotalea sp. M2MS4P-6]|uniref:hypothetical protein n=1 Tax=Actinotalea sp. M2MS4P-6 TaxID=2983762 RepID=UPI0021E3B43D|nr:hypothetical protein [Actinotalea sp. M2MS4P-6]MCV2393641.1 hypothetical protein [Actinotalea sp. M2MS4P-6]
MPARARLFGRSTDFDTLWGVSTQLPVATINGAGWATAATDRAQRRVLVAAGEALATLRSLKVAGTAHLWTLPVERTAPEPTIIDTALDIRVELAGDLVLHVMPHRAGGTAAVFFDATPQRCWVIELDDLAAAATTLLTMTAERVGSAAWAAEHGVPATSARLVPTADGQWRLGLATDAGFVMSEPNGTLVDEGRPVALTSASTPSQDDLAQVATDLTWDAASLLVAA